MNATYKHLQLLIVHIVNDCRNLPFMQLKRSNSCTQHSHQTLKAAKVTNQISLKLRLAFEWHVTIIQTMVIQTPDIRPAKSVDKLYPMVISGQAAQNSYFNEYQLFNIILKLHL